MTAGLGPRRRRAGPGAAAHGYPPASARGAGRPGTSTLARRRGHHSRGASVESARAQIVERIGTGPGPSTPGHIPFKGSAKKVLEMSLREALSLGHNYIGTEHILLGLLREGESDADSVVQLLGVDLTQVRAQVMALVGEARGGDPSWSLALVAAERRGRQAANPGPVTTGHVLVAMLGDRSSQAAR